MKKLQNKQPSHRAAGFSRRKIIVAACLFLATGVGLFWAIHILLTNNHNSTTVSRKSAGQHGFDTSYETISRRMDSYYENNNVYFSIADNSAVIDYAQTESSDSLNSVSKSTGSSAATDHSTTDTQVDGVMEGDIVNTDGNHIVTIQNSTTGFTASLYEVSGKKIEKKQVIPISNADYREMYLQDTTLVLIAQTWSQQERKTALYLYDISDLSNPVRLCEHTQDGEFQTSRLTDGYLYTFTHYTVEKQTFDKEKPETFVPRLDEKVMPADDILLLTDQNDCRYQVMTSLSLSNYQEFTDETASFGSPSNYYMSQENLYIVHEDRDSDWNSVKSDIGKYSYKNGLFTYIANTKIRGQIQNSYYMHEYKGNFVFVYTMDSYEGVSSNGLCVMDDKLNLIGELSRLGLDETIYASYFLDNMAYFVTYRETDPVFAVDLADPKNPVLKSELKLPGFSSYLHSFGENQLLGIGEGEENNVKFSLFSTENPENLSEISHLLMSPNTYSIAGSDHRVVFVDEARMLIGIGIDQYTSSHKKLKYEVYQWKNNRFQKVLSQKQSSPLSCLRGVRIGEYFYIVDVQEEQIQVYDIKTWKIAK